MTMMNMSKIGVVTELLLLPVEKEAEGKKGGRLSLISLVIVLSQCESVFFFLFSLLQNEMGLFGILYSVISANL